MEKSLSEQLTELEHSVFKASIEAGNLLEAVERRRDRDLQKRGKQLRRCLLDLSKAVLELSNTYKANPASLVDSASDRHTPSTCKASPEPVAKVPEEPEQLDESSMEPEKEIIIVEPVVSSKKPFSPFSKSLEQTEK